MSGASLAMALRIHSDHKTPQHNQTALEDVMESLRVMDLQLIAFITVFSASGLVPLSDLLFPAFTSAYLLLLYRLAFPEHCGAATSKQILFQPSRTFRLYEILGSAVGLFLPLAYVLGGFVRGDEHAVGSAAPHLFLLSFQILTENVVNGLSLFSALARVLVPTLYTARRIFAILHWVRDVWLRMQKLRMWRGIGWGGKGSLAAANLGYFVVNLFGFLIPRFLPKAVERY